MTISTVQQAILVLFSVFAGVLSGVFFDMYRLLRGIQCPGKIITFIQDLLFWVFTSLLVFIFLSINDYAYIGVYVYLWLVIGLGFYFYFISKKLIFVIRRFICIIGKFLRIAKNIIGIPFEVILEYYRKHKEI